MLIEAICVFIVQKNYLINYMYYCIINTDNIYEKKVTWGT